jgi:hypothetical protein
MQVCACIVRVSMNGRAQVWQVAGERWRESRSPIFKLKSSLGTSAIAPHALVLRVHEAPCTTGRSSKGQLQQQRGMYSRNRRWAERKLVLLVLLVNDSEYSQSARQ